MTPSRCSWIEIPIMSMLWNHGGQTKKTKQKKDIYFHQIYSQQLLVRSFNQNSFFVFCLGDILVSKGTLKLIFILKNVCSNLITNILSSSKIFLKGIQIFHYYLHVIKKKLTIILVLCSILSMGGRCLMYSLVCRSGSFLCPIRSCWFDHLHVGAIISIAVMS